MSVLNPRDASYRSSSTSTCPVHDVAEDRRQERSGSLSFGRSKSIDIGYIRSDAAPFPKHGTFHRDMSVESALRARKPFKHSHSVGCTGIDAKSQREAELKAKSVNNLAAPSRPRPNILELSPNQNSSFNDFRRRYSRSSDRSFDFEDCRYLEEFERNFSHLRYSRRSSSRDSGRSVSNLLERQQDIGKGRFNNIRKGLSMMSLCVAGDQADVDSDDNYFRQSSRILRPPTRHFHHRGMSGLSVKCPAKYMGVAY